MKMMHTKGGFSIAVYDPRSNEKDQKKVYSLISEDRVTFVAAADYSEGSALDLIVVGNRGHGPLAGLLHGSVAPRLLQAASLPVLLVPSAETTAG